VEFPDASDFASALDMRALRENLLVLRTFSKAFGLAALRVGYGIGPRRVIDYLDRIRAPFNVSSIALAAARAALEDLPHVQRYVALNAAERKRMSAGLSALGCRVAPSQANFVLVDVKRSGREVYDQLLRRGVIVRPMGPPIPTWLRITIGLPAENERLLAIMGELMGGAR
jgi:histidinol-phosphate aminotransferase